MFTEQIIQEVWERATIVKGYNETTIRKDSCGAWIIRSDYGNMNSIYGWEIDHIYPKEKGGKDDIDNLRALQWENNRSNIQCILQVYKQRGIEMCIRKGNCLSIN